MEFKSATTDGKWQSTLPDPTNQAALDGPNAPKQKLRQILTDILLSENLVVLCGLGTSLLVKGNDGQRLAPTMTDLWAAAEEMAGKKFEEIKTTVKYVKPPPGDDIELLLSQCQMSERFAPCKLVNDFVMKAEGTIVDKCRFVKGDTTLSSHESFLRKVGRRSTRLPRLKLFTTNYDLCFEIAASHVRFVAVDGFSHTQPQEFDGIHFSYDFVRRTQDGEAPDYIPNVFHFYKLHGSVDWELRGLQVFKATNPPKPLIIYPRYGKFESSYDQPFIEMMSRFQLSLRQPNTGLIIVGAGFNDHHITQPVLSAIRANVGLKAAFVSPSLKDAPKEPIANINSLIDKGDWRLTLVASTFEDLVSFLPDLIAETEEELHFQRVHAAGEKK
jgi:hypothetical protein